MLESTSLVPCRRGPRHIHLLILVLQLIQLEVHPAVRQQFLVRPHLADLPLMHDDDLVRTLHRRQPVRYDQRRPSFYHASERVTHFELGFRVDT